MVFLGISEKTFLLSAWMISRKIIKTNHMMEDNITKVFPKKAIGNQNESGFLTDWSIHPMYAAISDYRLINMQ